MTNEQSIRLLNALAAQDPAYPRLSSQYGDLLDGPAALAASALPQGLPEELLDFLRRDPETAMRLDQAEERLAAAQSFGLGTVTLSLLAVLVLLGPSLRIEWRRDRKGGHVEIGLRERTQNAAALWPLLAALGGAIEKAGGSAAEIGKNLQECAKLLREREGKP